jgi:adenosylhomocysteine nucleosidase
MSKPIGIIGAMDIEVNGIVASMSDTTIEEISGIKYYSGTLFGKSVVVAKCGIGKVFAAICSQTMILKYKPCVIINTGVAGSLSKELNILDVTVASKVVQHDMDTSAIGDPKGLISGINVIYFETDSKVTDKLEESAILSGCNTKVGIIASGDKFMSVATEKEAIKDEFKAIACEMEGASIGHVCFVNNTPFGVIRAISDSEGAEMDYMTFAEKAAENSIKITKKFVEIY